jgi:hypothetical protein
MAEGETGESDIGARRFAWKQVISPSVNATSQAAARGEFSLDIGGQALARPGQLA